MVPFCPFIHCPHWDLAIPKRREEKRPLFMHILYLLFYQARWVLGQFLSL